jgi:catechol 2,3-dioxygenase-like lactoylglutathione lyase family enzyme
MNWYSEIQAVPLGVRSFARTRAFLEAVFGYRCVDESTASHDCASSLSVPVGVSARSALLGTEVP